MVRTLIFGLGCIVQTACGLFASDPAPATASATATPAVPAGTTSPCAPGADPPEAGSVCVGPGPQAEQHSININGGLLKPCASKHETGFYRDGFCNTGADDHGVHVVCAEVDQAFLDYSKSKGNDLITARGSFPGLKAGDAWCLCAARWQEAYSAGVAPTVYLAATEKSALRFIEKNALLEKAIVATPSH